MNIYSKNDIVKSLVKVGIKKSDTIFVNPEIYKFGIYRDSKNLNYFKDFYEILKKIIGANGTICLNTYTFNTLRNKETFNYNSFKTTSGRLSQIILQDKNKIRSIHPVFSVSAVGKNAKYICKNNSRHNYGYNSPYWKMLKCNCKIISLGMDPWINPFNHIAEYFSGVPYYYNKFTNVKYLINKQVKNETYSSFVRFKNFNLVSNYNLIKKELKKKNLIKKQKLGDGFIYSINSKKYFDVALELLSKNQFAFIEEKFYLKYIKKTKNNF